MHSLRGWMMICGLSWLGAEAVPATSARLVSALARDESVVSVEARGRLGDGEASLVVSASSARGQGLTFVCGARMDGPREAAPQ